MAPGLTALAEAAVRALGATAGAKSAEMVERWEDCGGRAGRGEVAWEDAARVRAEVARTRAAVTLAVATGTVVVVRAMAGVAMAKVAEVMAQEEAARVEDWLAAEAMVRGGVGSVAAVAVAPGDAGEVVVAVTALVVVVKVVWMAMAAPSVGCGSRGCEELVTAEARAVGATALVPTDWAAGAEWGAVQKVAVSTVVETALAWMARAGEVGVVRVEMAMVAVALVTVVVVMAPVVKAAVEAVDLDRVVLAMALAGMERAGLGELVQVRVQVVRGAWVTADEVPMPR